MTSRPAVFAHRGARRVAPENTLPAFERALTMGVAGIEFDVHLTRDERLVVIHDFTVDKTTNGRGAVASMTAAEVRRLDAGSHFGAAFAGVQVPFLEEVLDLVGDRCRLNIEIKSMDPYANDASAAVAAVIRDRRLYDQVLVSSFNPISLIKLRHLDPKIALGMLYGSEMPVFLRQVWAGPPIRPEAQHPEHTLIDAAYMAWARALPAAVNTWTVNDVEEAQRLAGLGVDIIMSDVPDQIMAGLAHDGG
ncbi:MAG TPA: glycerophosphodiester phosphodiesterase [Chloroflexi bacterium]|nr:glycerophosphodiester phosphodiesterase [Chloroflexota bacterium]HHW84601.1 glycerophosphodiester phosphodiesterase [Chloroflexota bacterium]